uniref:RNA helicase n=1 Tax=Glossina brevipalpis TaxID=37001 RepID=A0A1A9WVB7_9MUSC
MQKEAVVITHFINPHLFWYHKVEDFPELDDIQQQIQLIDKSKRGFNYHPQLKEKVAVNFLAWNKVIRAEVLCEAQWQKGFVVWALDYGFPFRTKTEHICRLPREMARHIDYIRCGGIANILPAENEYDIMESDFVMTLKDNWRQHACDILEKLFMNAKSITFVEQFVSTNNHHWGNLIVVNQKGKVLDAREHLLSVKFALENAERFRNINHKLKTISILQYQSNCGKLTARTNSKIKADKSHHCVVQNSTSTIDEFAKGKIEDSHVHNKSQNDLIDDVESVNDDVTLDDWKSLSPNENKELYIPITNYIGKAGTLAKIQVGRDDLKWPEDEHFKAKYEINSEENSSSDLYTTSVPTQQILKLGNKYVDAEEDRSQNASAFIYNIKPSISSKLDRVDRSMNFSREYKEIEESGVANSSSLQTIVSSSLDRNKKLGAKRHEELTVSAGSPSSLKYQKCEPLRHANCSSHNNESALFAVDDIQPLKNSKDKYSHGTHCRTHSITNEGKENVEQDFEKMRDEIISKASSLNITTNQHEALTKSHKIKCPKKVNGKDIKNNRASLCDNVTNNNKSAGGVKKSIDPLQDDSIKMHEKYDENNTPVAFLDDFIMRRKNAPLKQSPPLIIRKSLRNSQSDGASKFNKDINIPKQHKIKLSETEFESLNTTLDKTECQKQRDGGEGIPKTTLPNTSFSLRGQTGESLSVSGFNNNGMSSSFSNHRAILEHQAKVNSITHMKKKQTILNFEVKNELPVLAHSNAPLHILKTMNQAKFSPQIRKEMLSMGINQIYPIQKYAWTHLPRNNSLFIVSPSKSGKTWSYLPSLCNDTYFDMTDLKPTYGPVAIILVASAKHVEKVTAYCRRLMSGLKDDAHHEMIVPFYGLHNFQNTKIKLLNSCGMLITTAPSLLRLLNDIENNEYLFNGERLKRIIIDDMDLIMSYAQEDLQRALTSIFTLCQKTKAKTLTAQILATFRNWDVGIMKLIRLSNQPLLLIGDFLEATVYGGIEFLVKLSSSKMKKKEIIHRFLKKYNKIVRENNRTMIICNEDYEVEELITFLAEYDYLGIGYTSTTDETGRTLVHEWKHKMSSDIILVCTDAALLENQIRNVRNLLHYSMPTSWTEFDRRFSVLIESYDNLLINGDTFDKTLIPTTTTKSTKACSLILLDKDENLKLTRLIDFMRVHQQITHPNIRAMLDHSLIALENARVYKRVQLCSEILEFGDCIEPGCDKRHRITNFDVVTEEDNIPMNGEICIHILEVFSPTHYAARLLEYKPLDAKQWFEVRRSRSATAFIVELDLHYRDAKNIAQHWPPQIDDICIYKYRNTYKRARILDISNFPENVNIIQESLKLTIKLIDDGIVIKAVQCNEIFTCDEKFKEFPYQAIDIRLMNVMPLDNERVWDSMSTKHVRRWIKDDIKEDSNVVVHVNVNFAFASTIWINDLIVMKKLQTTIGVYGPLKNLKNSLIKHQLALLNTGDRKSIFNLVSTFMLKLAAASDKNIHDFENEEKNSENLCIYDEPKNEVENPNDSEFHDGNRKNSNSS